MENSLIIIMFIFFGVCFIGGLIAGYSIWGLTKDKKMQDRIKGPAIFLLVAANILFFVSACQTREIPTFEETRGKFYVDSVWSRSPGEINTLQTDVVYFGRTTDGEVHTSRSRISVGDSFVYIYRRVR